VLPQLVQHGFPWKMASKLQKCVLCRYGRYLHHFRHICLSLLKGCEICFDYSGSVDMKDSKPNLNIRFIVNRLHRYISAIQKIFFFLKLQRTCLLRGFGNIYKRITHLMCLRTWSLKDFSLESPMNLKRSSHLQTN